MIKETITLFPDGDKSRKETLMSIEICNKDGMEDDTTGDYYVAVFEGGSAYRGGVEITRFRSGRGAPALVCAALKALGYGAALAQRRGHD